MDHIMRQRALVTGAGSGIGRGIALALARRSAIVALVGRRSERLQEVARHVEALGGTAHCLSCDITKSDQRDLLVEQIHSTMGSLTTLIHNAGVLYGGPLINQPAHHLEQMVTTNLLAPLLLTRAFASDLIAQNGSIVTVGSNAGRAPLPGLAAYSASKSGLHTLTDALRYEFAPLGVHLLLAIPSGTTTAMVAAMQQNATSRWYRAADADVVGEQIVQALEQRKTHLAIQGGDRVFAALHRYVPWLMKRLLMWQRQRFIRMMTPRNE